MIYQALKGLYGDISHINSCDFKNSQIDCISMMAQTKKQMV